MRLTLRTLLAYLDDVLDPTNARELGQKIEESAVASSLIEKVREVLRKRRLEAPEATDYVDFNPNDVAKYLDNLLPPELVVEFEKKCLDASKEGEERLAEVAASHQILSLILGDTVEVRLQSRERMYRVVQETIAASEEPPSVEATEAEDTAVIQTYGLATPEVSNSSAVSSASSSGNQPFDEPFGERLPGYSREQKKGWLSRFWPALLVTTLGVASGIAIVGDMINWGQPTSTEAFQPVKGEEQQVAEGDTKISNPLQMLKKPTVPNAKTPVEPNKDGEVPASVNPKTPLDPNVPTVPAGKVPAVVGMTPKNPIPADPKAVNPKLAEPPMKGPVKPVPPALPVAKVQYVASRGVLMHQEAEAKEWFVSPDHKEFRPGDQIASLEPFRSMVEIPKWKATVKFDGGTSAVILSPQEGLPFGFQLNRGRIIVELLSDEPMVDDLLGSTPPKNPEGVEGENGKERMALGVQIEKHLWKIELTEPGTLFGLELTPKLPHHFEEFFGNEVSSIRLVVVKGKVRATQEGKPAIEIPAGNIFVIKTSGIDGEEIGLFESAPKDSSVNWVTTNPALRTLTRRKHALAFSREFETGQSINLSLPAIPDDKRPYISELGVKALALGNRYSDLVQALAKGKHEETREAAIVGLREWMPKSPENRALLKVELEKIFDETTAKHVYHLLWGYSKKEAQDPEQSKILVGWLQHENIAVRELAIYSIRNLTGRDYGYKSLYPASRRRSQIAQWKSHLERVGALITPEEKKIEEKKEE